MPTPEPPSKKKAGRNPKAMLARTAWFQVAFGRQSGHSDDQIRSDIRAAAKEAMEGNAEWMQDLTGEDGVTQPYLSRAGTFRMVIHYFDLDRSDQVAQESWLRAIEDAMEAALTRTDGDYTRRPAVRF